MDRNSSLSLVARLSLVLAIAVALLLGAGSILAQVDTGSILGTITDTSGGTVSGAKVTLTNEATGASLTFTTGPDGNFKFSPVRIGSYTVTSTLEGFQTSTQKSITVNVGSDVVANFTLQPGKVSEIVEVTGAAPVLQSQDASVGQVVDTQAVNNLPLNGRNFTFLAQISAGVNTPQADTRGNAASGAFAANGLRPSQNNYLLDGIDNNSDTVDFLNGTNFVVLPPVDAVQEFKVETSGFSAEHGRSGAAVLNATIKSGGNQFHGSAWEFFRNDHLDAADYFENANNTKKGALRQNQFGGTIGGPILKNKLFFFADYEGQRRVQGTILSGSVPTVLERNSNYTDFSDLLSATKTNTDLLGRILPQGTILDPSTTRATTLNVVDPVTGLPATATGFVRDPFTNGECAVGLTNYTGANASGCGLNDLSNLPDGRVLDANAIALLKLYPLPTNSKVFSNFANSPKLYEHRNSFDVRLDFNPNSKDQFFGRFSWVDDPQFIPGIFGGVADGGGFQQGTQTARATQTALGWTRTISPTVVNVAHIGFNYLHTSRSGPSSGDLSNIPLTYGIQDIPQTTLNGGLPAFGINGLATLGSNAFLPSDEVSSTFQAADDFTKIYGKHTFKAGFEYQHVKFSTLQPPWSRGEFDYNGDYTDVVGNNNGNTGRAAFLLIPALSSVGGVDYLGGSTNVFVSNISLTDNGKNYYGGYVQDDFKVTSKLTLNLGVRWDFFGLVFEHHGAQANFVPGGAPAGGPLYIIPSGPNQNNLSDSFRTLLAQDGITLVQSDKYGKGLGNSQPYNFSPRLGFAYQVSPKLVVRGGFGMFYNGFENRGFSPNLGENYPFQFNFNYSEPNNVTPFTFSTPCETAGPGNTVTFETGFSCTPLSPLAVNASGLGLRGIQFDYKTPYSLGGNLTLQYQLTPSMSVQAAYVTSLGRHLEVFPNSNNVSQIIPTLIAAPTEADPNAVASPNPQNYVPFKDFQRGGSYATTQGNSYYHALQTKLEKQFSGGLGFLATYTWSKVRTDAFDLLNGGVGQNYRAPDVPGFGIQGDYSLAPFDIRNVFHFSGSYDLPFGKGKKFATNASGVTNQLIGGWSINTIITLQDGQPLTITCPTGTTTGTSCNAFLVGNPKLGIHTDGNGVVSWIGNPAAFNQPCKLGLDSVPIADSPSGCIPVTGLAALGGTGSQIAGPGFHRMDFSIFKNFNFKERYTLQFRTEIFNIFNHANFNAPNFGGNGVVAISNSGNYTSDHFGEIGSTRDAPYDARQIQFALKFLF